jgi:hypothetical protein
MAIIHVGGSQVHWAVSHSTALVFDLCVKHLSLPGYFLTERSFWPF